MKPRALILAVELEPDDPQTAAVPAKTVATELCPSDHHAATGNIPIPVFPFWRRTRGGGHGPRSTDFGIAVFDLEMRNYV